MATRTRSPGSPPVTKVTTPSARPTPWPFSRRSSRRIEPSAGALGAPLIVKRMEQLIGFVDQRSDPVARGIAFVERRERADEQVRANRRCEESYRPDERVETPHARAVSHISDRLDGGLDVSRRCVARGVRYLVPCEQAHRVRPCGEDRSAAVDVDDVDGRVLSERPRCRNIDLRERPAAKPLEKVPQRFHQSGSVIQAGTMKLRSAAEPATSSSMFAATHRARANCASGARWTMRC